MQKEQVDYETGYLQERNTNADQFLKDVTIKVRTDLIYEVVDTYFYSNSYEAMAIELKVINVDMRAMYGGEYLFQVWNKESQLCYEVASNAPVLWCTQSDRYVIYKLREKDSNVEYFMIIDSKKKYRAIKVRDWTENKKVTTAIFGGKFLILATEEELLVATLEVPENDEKEVVVEVSVSDVCSYTPNLKIHTITATEHTEAEGDCYVYTERADGQLDVNKFKPFEVSKQAFKYENLQKTDYEYRPNTNGDKIAKMVVTCRNSVWIMAALRNSGSVDFYYNFSLISSKESNKEFKILDLDFNEERIFLIRDAFQLTLKKGTPSEITFTERSGVFAISKTLGQQISWERAQKRPPDFKWDTIKTNRCITYAQPFKNVALIRDRIFVIHGNYVSEYKVLESFWTSHIRFKSRIRCLFRTRPDNKEPFFHPAVILENGDVHLNCEPEEPKKQKGLKIMKSELKAIKAVFLDWTKQAPSHSLPQGIKEVILDEVFGKFLYLLDSENQLFLLMNGKMKKLDGIQNVGQALSIRNLQPTRTIQKLLVQFENTIDVYVFKNGVPEKPITLKIEQHEQEGNKKVVKPLKMGKILDCNVNDSGKKAILIDQDYIYHLDVENGFTRTQDLQPRGMLVLENKFVYMLCKGNRENPAGLYYIDGETFFDQKQCDTFLLAMAFVGNGQIDFSYVNQRFCFFKSLTTIEILPLLHQTSINLFSMPDRKDILSLKRNKDQVFALTKQNLIKTWDITTGKQNSSGFKPKGDEFYQNFVIFQTHESNKWTYASLKDPKTLLMSQSEEKVEDQQDFFKEFFDHSQMAALDQVPFQMSKKKSFREFRLIEIKNSKEIDLIRKFIHPCYEGFQRIFFSEDNKYMFEELEDSRCFFYEWKEESSKWGLLSRINSFPTYLQPFHCYRSIISPDLQRYIDYNAMFKQFVIRPMRQMVNFSVQETPFIEPDYTKKTSTIFIPQKVMQLEFSKHLNRKELPEETLLRFKWHNDNQFIFCDNSGIERLFDIPSKFEELAFNKMPYFERESIVRSTETDERTFKPPSYAIYDERRFIRERDQTLALQRISYQSYKRAINLFGATDKDQIFDSMFHLMTGTMDTDYSQLIRIQMSFSYLSWKILEKVKAGNQSLKDTSISRLKELCMTIVPSQDCILHFLNYDDLRHLHLKILDEKGKPKIEVPFTKNRAGQTALDIAISKDDSKTTNLILNYLKGFDMDHHSRLIVHQLPEIVKMDLPALMGYLESRRFTTPLTKEISTGVMPDQKPLYSSRYTIDKNEYNKECFEKEGQSSPVEVRIIDIPKIHEYVSNSANDSETESVDISRQFMGELAETSNFEIFKSPVVQSWILFRYPMVRTYTVYKLLIPYLVFLCILVTYIDYLIPNYRFGYIALKECQEKTPVCEDLDQMKYDLATSLVLNVVCQILVTLFSTYFLINEIKQIKKDKLQYFNSFWNYIDLIPLLLAYMIVINFYIDDDRAKRSSYETILYSLTPFFTWMKGLYFMRIFSKYAYLIRMIVCVVKDMRTFLAVLLITIFAFSDAYFNISMANSGSLDSIQAIAYVYRMSLGDFAYDEFEDVGKSLAQILFIICTMFNMIVLFNLLIAIISETFATVNANAEQAGLQEKASMIFENSYLVPEHLLISYTQKRSFLYTCEDLDEQIEEEPELPE